MGLERSIWAFDLVALAVAKFVMPKTNTATANIPAPHDRKESENFLLNLKGFSIYLEITYPPMTERNAITTFEVTLKPW